MATTFISGKGEREIRELSKALASSQDDNVSRSIGRELRFLLHEKVEEARQRLFQSWDRVFHESHSGD